MWALNASVLNSERKKLGLGSQIEQTGLLLQDIYCA